MFVHMDALFTCRLFKGLEKYKSKRIPVNLFMKHNPLFVGVLETCVLASFSEVYVRQLHKYGCSDLPTLN